VCTLEDAQIDFYGIKGRSNSVEMFLALEKEHSSFPKLNRDFFCIFFCKWNPYMNFFDGLE
jgi:hypothetical protein